MINKIPNPQTKRFRISYIGEFLGDIIKTFNINLLKRGKAERGAALYPHTTGIELVSDFQPATIDNGLTGATGPTGPTYKLWAVGDDNKVYHSYNNEAFQTGPTGGFASDESTWNGSDILSVGDETDADLETTPVSISGTTLGNIIVSGTGATRIAAQSFQANGDLEQVTLSVQKAGTPADDLEVAIQGDSGGEPDGVDLTVATIDPADLEDDEYTDIELDISDFTASLKMTTPTQYWLVLRRSGAADTEDFYMIRSIIGGTNDPYTRGAYYSYDGTDWIRIDELNDTQGDDDTASFPTANNAVPASTGWTDADNAQTDTSDSSFASATPPGSTSYKHVWKTFGFNIPTGAIAVGYEVNVRGSLNTDDYGNPPIFISLTKDASTKIGTEQQQVLRAAVATTKHGSSTDNWGVALTPAEINDANFGVRIDTNDGHPSSLITWRIQWITMKVYYYENDPADENFMDAQLKVQTSFPKASERLYLTTTKDVLFNGSETTNWNSLWRGILQQDDLNENYPAILKNLGSGGTLVLANENKIHTMIATATQTTEADPNRLIFDSTHYINWMGVTSSAIFGGLRHKESATLPSQVFYYEPFSERIRIFTIKEGETVGFIKDENCHIIDKKGQMRVFTGTHFQTYNYFPPYYRDENITTLPHRNGIKVVGDIVKILWEGQYPDPAGVWTYQDDNLYHRHALVTDTTSIGSIETNDLRALHDDNGIWVGGSVENALEANLKGIYSIPASGIVSNIRGNIVTSKFTSPEINNLWQDILLKYEDGTFVAKQKVEANGLTEGVGAPTYSGEWTATDTFTCTDAAFSTAVTAGTIKVGDEIIVRKGAAAGLLAHITEIDGTTITIDDGVATTGKFTFSVERWAKINLDYKTDKLSAKASLKDQRLENAQFKIDMRGTLEEIQVNSIVNTTIKR